MDHYSILGEDRPAATLVPPRTADFHNAEDNAKSDADLRFPGDDGGHSLAEMAARDLFATLQLLADRAGYITGSSGVVIALRENGGFVCRANAGKPVPEVGSALVEGSGLWEECVRTQKILCCPDVSTDPRVNPECCRGLGIGSAVVLPLVREQRVEGVFQFLSDKPHTFGERDLLALQRLGEMIQTAIDHAEAVQTAHTTIHQESSFTVSNNDLPSGFADRESPVLNESKSASSTSLLNHTAIGKCASCGFPVSAGRTLCVDCEQGTTVGPELSPYTARQDFSAVDDYSSNQAGWPPFYKYALGLMATGVAIMAWLLLHS